MTVTVLDPREQLADAVKLCRQYRHHPDCRCYAYRNQQGAPFCTAYESSWTTIVDKLIDRVREQLA